MTDAQRRAAPGAGLRHGQRADGVVTLPDAMSPDAVSAGFDDAVTRARQLPGVSAAGATQPAAVCRQPLEPESRPRDRRAAGNGSGRRRLGRGLCRSRRDWSSRCACRSSMDDRSPMRDGAEAPPVAMVNQAMARRFWPGRSPIGARLRRGGDAPGEWRTVVGVVGDIRNDDADQPPLPYLYVPLAQQPVRTMALTLRTAGDPVALADAAAQRSADVSIPNQALYDVRTMRQTCGSRSRARASLIQVMSGARAGRARPRRAWRLGRRRAVRRPAHARDRRPCCARRQRLRKSARLIARQGLVPIATGLVVGLAGGTRRSGG